MTKAADVYEQEQNYRHALVEKDHPLLRDVVEMVKSSVMWLETVQSSCESREAADAIDDLIADMRQLIPGSWIDLLLKGELPE